MARKTAPQKAHPRPPNKKGKQPLRRTAKEPKSILRPGTVLLYGRNSVEAALANPNRIILEVHGDISRFETSDANTGLAAASRFDKDTSPVLADLDTRDLPHQGMALVVKPLPQIDLYDLIPASGPCSLLVLDQVSDPQNIGAALRVAAALGVAAVVTQDKHSPQESGSLARAAAGMLERQPWVQVSNIARTLDKLKEKGFWIAGLDGTASETVDQANLGDRYVLVMGSEGRGLRPLVRDHCDHILKIPMAAGVESLNVSVAAGIALYALGRQNGQQ